jgi:hypothetical protein
MATRRPDPDGGSTRRVRLVDATARRHHRHPKREPISLSGVLTSGGRVRLADWAGGGARTPRSAAAAGGQAARMQDAARVRFPERARINRVRTTRDGSERRAFGRTQLTTRLLGGYSEVQS